MNYLNAVSLIGQIEHSYDVMSIKYKDVPVWPLLRINIIDTISKERTKSKNKGNSAVKQVLRTLFYYNPLILFKRSSIWLFAGNERRKLIDNKYILRVSGGILDVAPETLVIEKPSINQHTISRNYIPEKNIVSESWILLFVHILSFILRPFNYKLSHEDILLGILRDNNIYFNYRKSLCLLLAQKLVLDFILFFSKPEKVLIECPYTIMGYVWAFRSKGIPVIELQHGVLNAHHYAYNSLFHSDFFYPDSIWVFGDVEYTYLTSSASNYTHDVRKTGLYFMELAERYFSNDIFSAYRKRYNYIVVVAGQRGYENQLASFVKEVASSCPDCLFYYIPRTSDENIKFSLDNVIFKYGVNIYEYMKWCDFHVTISSTTCLECQFFRKPTIFYDFDKMATNYYGTLLNKDNGAFYIDDPKEFNNVKSLIENSHFNYKEIFTRDTVNNFKRLLV